MLSISDIRTALKELPIAPVAKKAGVARSTVMAIRDESTANPGYETVQKVGEAIKAVRRQRRGHK